MLSLFIIRKENLEIFISISYKLIQRSILTKNEDNYFFTFSHYNNDVNIPLKMTRLNLFSILAAD